jgi:hypothetical protein
MDRAWAAEAQARLGTDAQRLRGAATQLASAVAQVAQEVAASRERAAATYRTMAHNHPTRGDYYLRRAADMDELAVRARAFAASETDEAARSMKASRAEPRRSPLR